MSRSDDSRPRRLALAGICIQSCLLALAAVPILFGTPWPLVYIEWRGWKTARVARWKIGSV